MGFVLLDVLQKMKAPLLVSLTIVTVAAAFLSIYGRSKGPDYSAKLEWGRLNEFHAAWQDYRNQDAFPGADTVRSENRKLFPLHFEDLDAYGRKDNRRFLKTKEDFRALQSSIKIDIENEKYFEDQHIEPDSWLESQSVILHKDVLGNDGAKLKVILTYGGDIFVVRR